jgi:hypothetical protein
MATLREITQEIIRHYSGGDQSKDSTLDFREVRLMVLQILNAAIKVEYFDNIRTEGFHGTSAQYITSYVVSVQKDSLRKEAYINVPWPYIALPWGKGIHEISPMNDRCTFYIPVQNGFNSLFKGLPAGNLEMYTGFYGEGNKVFFTKDITGQGVQKVLVKLIHAVDDNTPIDPATEETLFVKVSTLLKARGDQDKINDNNPAVQA